MSSEQDGKSLVLVALHMLGASIVVPWLSYITSIDYFLEIYPSHKEIEYVFAVVNMSVLVAGTTMMLWVGIKWDLHMRLLISISLLTCFMFGVPVLGFTGASVSSWGYTVTLISQFLCASTNSVMQSSLYGLVAILGGDSIQALETGKGIAGITIIALRLLTKALFPGQNDVSMIYFFAVSISILASSFFLYLMLRRQPFAMQRFKRHEETMHSKRGKVQPAPTEATGLLIEPSGGSLDELDMSPTRVLRKIWPLALTVVLVFTVCLGLFPGLTTSLTSTTYNLGDWFPLFLIAIFNCADVIGKSLPHYGICFDTSTLYRPILLELVLVPLFMVAACNDESAWLNSDAYIMVIVGLLGLCTGYFGCALMIMGPGSVSEHDKELAGQIMSLFLISGLFFGAAAGYLLDFALGG